jgi:hypothetical protein
LVATPSLLFDPRIFQPHAAAFEVGSVPRGQDAIAGVHDGGDLRVQVWDGSAMGAAAGCDEGKGVCGFYVKGQHRPPKSAAKIAWAWASILSPRFPLGRSSSPKRISATLMAVTKKWPFSGFWITMPSRPATAKAASARKPHWCPGS